MSTSVEETDTIVRALADRIVDRYRGSLMFVPGAGWHVRDPASGRFDREPDVARLATAIAVQDAELGNPDLAARICVARADRATKRRDGRDTVKWLRKSKALPLVLAALELAAGELRCAQVMEPRA